VLTKNSLTQAKIAREIGFVRRDVRLGHRLKRQGGRDVAYLDAFLAGRFVNETLLPLLPIERRLVVLPEQHGAEIVSAVGLAG
jgi:hypothetical protein